MTLDFYYTPGSAPCRSVLLTAKAVGVDLNLKQLDLFKGEQLAPSFLEINPQHTVPTLNDNGFALWESRAIMTYLAEKYGKDDSLYPADIKIRAQINQRLYFDLGTLYNSFANYYYPVLFGNEKYDPEKKKKIEDALKFLDTFVESGYAVGDSLTLADLTLVATISTFDIVEYDLSSYANVQKWYKNIQEKATGYDEANRKPLEQFRVLFQNLTASKQAE